MDPMQCTMWRKNNMRANICFIGNKTLAMNSELLRCTILFFTPVLVVIGIVSGC